MFADVNLRGSVQWEGRGVDVRTPLTLQRRDCGAPLSLYVCSVVVHSR